MSSPTLRERLKGVSLIFACGTALFSDGYANGIIGPVNTLLRHIYGPDVISQSYSTTLNSVVFAGTVLGMLTFGWISDKVGRKFGMMSAAGIVAFFSALSAASSGANHSVHGMLAMLVACRFFLGIGIGAEYPCGSVSASEKTEGKAIAKNAQNLWFTLATANSMIDAAWVVSAFVALLMVWMFCPPLRPEAFSFDPISRVDSCGPSHLRAAWRLALWLGFFPAAAVFTWRWTMDEPELYKQSSMKKVKIPYILVLRKYGVRLAAISLTWFLYDFITITGGDSALTTVFGWAVVINLFNMPGTISGAFIVDYLGPKYTMITGLLFQAFFGFIMSGLYTQLKQHIAAFAVIYGIFLCFGALGPGNCLGLLASKTSPTAARGQFYGIAAAIGKVGAFVRTWAFPPMIAAFGKDNPDKGNTGPFWVGSGLAIISAPVTFFFIVPLDHDGMAREDAIFRKYLEENGFDTSAMGLFDGSSSIAVDSPEKDRGQT
ncbi:major facilitator superfamily domain-containing protein [Mycena crocata]|nr:major facilitator superfamily domain-containing protein [Mycena crocata]